MRTTGIGERPRLIQDGTADHFEVTVAGIRVGRIHSRASGWNAITPTGDHRVGFTTRELAADWLAEQELGR